MFGKKKKMYDFYLGGPMKGYKDLNRPMFLLVAKLLRDKGFTVWNPAEKDSCLQSSLAECMTNDLNAVISECHTVAFLPGWRSSLGTNTEAFVAFACDKAGVEVVLSKDNTDFDLVPVDLSLYGLPYQTGEDSSEDDE